MNAQLAYQSDSRLSIKSINSGAPRTPKCQERALGRRRGPGTHGGQDLTSHDESPRTSKPSSPSEEPDSRVLRGYCRAKEFGNPAHFISSSRSTLRRKKCPRMNKEGLNCQETLPRTILFSKNRDHGRRKRHATKGSLLERPKGKHKCNEIVMRE